MSEILKNKLKLSCTKNLYESNKIKTISKYGKL